MRTCAADIRNEQMSCVTPQDNFNFYIKNLAVNYGMTIDEVLNLALVKEYSKEIGLSYTGDMRIN